MIIKSADLDSSLKNHSLNLFLIYGNEILLVNESMEKIKAYSKKHGYLESVKFDINPGFVWNSVLVEINNISLFSSNKLIIINLGNGKIGVKGSNFIDDLVQSIPNNIHILLVADKLEKSQLSNKWFKTLAKNGLVVPHYSVEISQLLNWTIEKLNEIGIQNNQKIAELIAVNP